MSKIHIFGGTGLLGSHLERLCKTKKIECLTYSRSKSADYQLDISKINSFKNIPPPDKNDFVVNLAAISQPGKVFHNQKLAYGINVNGNENIISWTNNSFKVFFFMSSVEVFDGSKDIYSEESQVCPINQYGFHKSLSESYIMKNLSKRYIIGRTSWNISNINVGRCLVDTMIESLKKENAIMAIDNIFTIASAYETALNILKSLESEFQGILHIASPSPISRYEIAEIIMNNYSFQKLSCKKCYFSELNFEEPRSKKNILDTSLSIKKINARYSDPRSIIFSKLLALNN